MVTWDDTTDKKLLLTIIQVLGPEKLQWAEILEKMGEEFTMESIKSRYKKIKGGQAKGEPGTPAEKKTKAKAASAGTGGKRKKGKEVEEEPAEATPSKKTKVKGEAEGEGDGESEDEMA